MGFFSQIAKGLKKDAQTFTRSFKAGMIPSSNLVDSEYDYGTDVGRKILFVIMVWVGILMRRAPDQALAVFLGLSIFGTVFLVMPMGMFLKKKTAALREKENAKRFLHMSPMVWHLIVGLYFAGYMIFTLFHGFTIMALFSCFIVFLVSFGLLKGDVGYAPSTGKSGLEKVGSPEWRKENGVERVLVPGSQWAVYRDKNGNYYEDRFGQFAAIPMPVNVQDKK